MRKGERWHVFTGPSGAGRQRGTVLSRLLSEDEQWFFSISATTRSAASEAKIRRGSIISSLKEDFEAKTPLTASSSTRSTLINYYGIAGGLVKRKSQAGDVILEIEVQGATVVYEKRPDAVMKFIAPPSFYEIANRLRGRGTRGRSQGAEALKRRKGELAQR